MKISQLITETASGKMVRGMLVQTLDQFVNTGGSKRPDEDIDEDQNPEIKPVIFAPPIKAKYTLKPEEMPDDDVVQPTDRDEYSKEVSPEELARMVHHKNTYVIYYEYKSPSDPKKVLEKSITTEPIYISKDKIDELSQKARQYVEERYPKATETSKKSKAYYVLSRFLEKLAVEEAIKNSPEVKYALDKGLLPRRLKAKQFTTTAAKAKNPSIHKSSVPIINEEGEIIYDLDGLANRITQPPTEILKFNEKMAKSAGPNISMANIGIPAIAGLVVDEKTKKFVVVNTCPGAGICKSYCYATRGGYVQYSTSAESQARILNYWYNHPARFKQQVINELKAMMKRGKKVYLRWHDSGDFFTDAYLHLAFDVARELPEVIIYAYTKIAKVAKDPMMPENFLINFSAGAKPQETKEIDYKKIKHSIVVPDRLFKDEKTTGIGLERLQDRDPEAQNRLKEVIAEQYDLDVKSILTYDEMLRIPEGRQLKYNVIVVPGLDGDLGAARRDVLGSFLLEH